MASTNKEAAARAIAIPTLLRLFDMTISVVQIGQMQ